MTPLYLLNMETSSWSTLFRVFITINFLCFTWTPSLNCMGGVAGASDVRTGSSLLDKSEFCGSPTWTYDDHGSEKCFKVLHQDDARSMKSYDEAAALCAQEDVTSALPSIESSEDEEFLVSFVQRTSSPTNHQMEIFMAVQNMLVRPDNSTFRTQGKVTNDHDDDDSNPKKCLHITIDNSYNLDRSSVTVGQWNYTDNNCDRVNLIICEKPATWPPSKILKTFLNYRKQSTGTLKGTQHQVRLINEKIRSLTNQTLSQQQALRAELNVARSEVAELTRKIRELMTQHIEPLKRSVNGVPIGFIYVQYGGQVTPSTLWPTFTWSDVTASYAGQFFRAQGGNSAAFGITQAGDSPRVTQVEYEDHENHPVSATLPVGGRSASVRSGNWNSNGDKVGLVFTTSGGEVRPYNSAVKIWKRIS